MADPLGLDRTFGLLSEMQTQAPELPPMPEDPLVCRWCGGRRVMVNLFTDSFCPALCSRNDLAPFTHECPACGCTFQTGRHHPGLCPRCEAEALSEREQGERRLWTRDEWLERRER